MNPSSVSIDVVIPAYNEEKTIRACIESLLHQTYTKPYRIIVIDNNSTDTTYTIASSYPSVIVKSEKRKGYVFAVKTGIEKYSHAAIVAQTDADTVVSSTWIETIAHAFTNDPSLVACGGPFYYTDGFFPIRVCINAINYLMPNAFSMYICGLNMAYRRTAYDTVDGYDTSINLGADTFLGMKLKKYGSVQFFRSLYVFTTLRRFAKPKQFIQEAARQSGNFISLYVRKKPLFFSNTDYRY